MKIRQQSAEILDWTHLDLYQRIEAAARICYRSEPKGSAGEFVRKRIEQGHLAVLEFARIKLPGGQLVNARRLYEWIHATGPTLAHYNISVPALAMKWPALFPGVTGEAHKDDLRMLDVANDYIPVLFVCNRAQSHQIVRHRLCSFAQESQRYCNYSAGKFERQVTFIWPPEGVPERAREVCLDAMQAAEDAYLSMLDKGASPQQARLVLPNSTATRLVAYASPEEWRHIFSLRCDRAADPAMQALMKPLQKEMQERGLV